MLLYNQKPLLGKLPIWANPAGIPQPVGFWAVNERSGNIYNSITPYGTGVITNGYWVPNGVYCDGVDDYITIPNDGRFCAPEHTVVIKFNLHTGGHNDRLMTVKTIWNDNIGWAITLDGVGNIFNYVSGASGAGANWKDTTNVTWSNNETMTIAITQSGTAAEVYKNGGEYRDSLAMDDVIDLSTNPLLIFRDAIGGNEPEATLHHLIYYNRALTPQQIAYLHQHPYYAWEYPEVWEYYVAVAGRTTKNTDAWFLGQQHGESFRMVG